MSWDFGFGWGVEEVPTSLVMNLGLGCWRGVARRADCLWSDVLLRPISAHNTNKVAIC